MLIFLRDTLLGVVFLSVYVYVLIYFLKVAFQHFYQPSLYLDLFLHLDSKFFYLPVEWISSAILLLICLVLTSFKMSFCVKWSFELALIWIASLCPLPTLLLGWVVYVLPGDLQKLFVYHRYYTSVCSVLWSKRGLLPYFVPGFFFLHKSLKFLYSQIRVFFFNSIWISSLD